MLPEKDVNRRLTPINADERDGWRMDGLSVRL